jgi:type IV secretion system protein VirD4
VAALAVAGGALWFVSGRTATPTQPDDSSAYGSHGTARWAVSHELRRYLRPDGHGFIFGKLPKHGLFDRQAGYLTLPADPKLAFNQNVTVIGSSGSRKTRSVIQPNIQQSAMYGRESLIVIDPKGENYARSANLLRDRKFKVYLLNLLHPEHSDAWNPLDAVTGVLDAADLANNLVANTINPNRPKGGDPFWDNAEQGFITALVLYVKLHRPPAEQHMASVLELGTELPPEELDTIFLALKPEDPARRFYRSFLRAEEKVRAGVVAGLGNRLQLWNSPELAHLTATSTFHIDKFGEEPSALFLVIPDSKATYAPILALFWQQAFEVLYMVADQHGGSLPLWVRCYMDEMANCGFIPGYEQKKSTMRSRGVSTQEIWQNLTQMQGRYPAWEEMLANSDHLLLLGANDLRTVEYISKKLGNTTVRIHSSNSNKSDRSASSGQGNNYTGRPLMTPDEVLRLPADQAVLIPRGQHPAKIRKADYTEHPLAAEIKEDDHKTYQAPGRPDLTIIDVKTVWQESRKKGAQAAASSQSHPQQQTAQPAGAQTAAAPATPQPDPEAAGTKPDPLVFLDEQKPKEESA